MSKAALAVLFFSSLLFAQSEPSLPDEKSVQARKVWQRISQENQERILSRWGDYKSLPPQERNRLRSNFERYEQMDSKKQEVLRRNWQVWNGISAERKLRLKKSFEKWLRLDEKERDEILGKIKAQLNDAPGN